MKEIIRLLSLIYYCYIKYRTKQFNKENINNIDKCVICCNHSNKDDATWILSSNKNTYVIAKLSLFKNKFNAIVLYYLNTFPVRNRQINSIRNIIKLFRSRNKIKLLVFIEATRKKEKKGKAKNGAIYIAIKAGVPVVPVYIDENVKKFSKVNIIYGKPIYYNEDLLKDKQKLEEATNDLLNAIYLLKNKSVL